ncbi:hypothetical protein Ct9H90mP29_22720 [bacterium]|nr:MAG: hypothetical protein Ct9H90mP29_22720 [bacterium]
MNQMSLVYFSRKIFGQIITKLHSNRFLILTIRVLLISLANISSQPRKNLLMNVYYFLIT